MKSRVKSLLKKLRILFLLKTKYRSLVCGKDFYCGKNLSISKHIPKGDITLGDHVFIGQYSLIAAKVDIEDYCMLASFVAIVGGDHQFSVIGTPMTLAGSDELKKGVIQKDVWVGHGTIILQGLMIGEGSIVGAGSVVTKDVPPYSIVAGNPAKFIRYRFNSKEDCIKHSQTIKGIYANSDVKATS